jgi:molybdate transport system substrate-binding protein
MMLSEMRQDHSTRGIAGRGAVLVMLALGGWVSACTERPPMVAAASDLQFALTEIAGRFARERGTQVEVVFGSSGTLTRQLRDGAPFELFLSADEKFVEEVAAAGLTRDRGVRYATGRLALFAPTGSPLVPGEGLDGLARLIAAGRVTRFAIANPEHAPYGRAAQAALGKHGLWDDVQPSLVLGDNVSQAAQFATSGNAVGGIIAHSLALAPNVRSRGTFALIPDTDHPPLLQRMVLLNRATPVAEQFYRYLQEPAARAIFEEYGFALPDR